MTIADLDLIVDDYLRQLETALGSLPTARRAQIITEIAEHVSQARSGLPVQDEASIRSADVSRSAEGSLQLASRSCSS